MSVAGRRGRLFIIGGGEDREDAKEVLERFVELCGGPGSSIVVITAASKIGEKVWEVYDSAFGELGVKARAPIHIESRAAANNPATAAQVAAADGIFISGGDQKRLLALVGGTTLDAALSSALTRGACVAGTSAGASAMSAHMLAYGRAEAHPVKGTIGLGAGFGFLQRIIIDQHFSERHRLSRLLAIVAQNPGLLGVGIDEDTALLVECGNAIEVFGSGVVTVVDGREMVTNVSDIQRREVPELVDVRLHILPAGTRHVLADAADRPAALNDFLRIVTDVTTS
ncbi:MAG: cyanophycinase [Massilia sp.]|nr:cyanophycinase [Massilia sp.]